MTIEIKMPALSPTMERGTLAKWLVAEGDAVRAGDIIAEIETDKATMEFEAPEDGTLAKILCPDGSDDIPVGTVIALIGEGAADAASAEAAEMREVIAPRPPVVEESKPAPSASGESAAPTATIEVPHARLADKIKISPLAARIAHAKSIDVDGLSGSGPYGRIVKSDLGLPAAPTAPAAISASLPAMPFEAAPPPPDVPFDLVPHNGMRRTIARRLTEAKQTIPHFYLTVRCRLDALLALRAELNGALAPTGAKLSVNDLLIKAMALAMAAEPCVNVQYGTHGLYRFDRADISVAVAVDGGLVTPVIRDAGALSPSAISARSRDLAERARTGQLRPEDYAGGTASISNLGMFGIDEMIPVINPPHALILGIGAGIEQPSKVDGELGLATIMAATASFDHRAIDGATGARFLAAFRDIVEDPLRILA